MTQDACLTIKSFLEDILRNPNSIKIGSASLQNMIDSMSTCLDSTEDFVLCFENEQLAADAEQKILEVCTIDTEEIFYVETADKAIRTLNKSAQIFHTENRGKDIYIQLKPVSALIPNNAKIKSNDVIIPNFGELVSLAQVKNTHHHGIGYYTDTGFMKGELPESFPLKDLFALFLDAYGIDSPKFNTMDPELQAVLRGQHKLAMAS